MIAQRAKPEVILIASGSEVPLALEAYERVMVDGTATRVASMPSWFLFERQSRAYQDQVLPSGIDARLAIEAASPFGWERYVGSRGRVLGMTRFGASAPYRVLAEQFGFNAGKVVQLVHELQVR